MNIYSYVLQENFDLKIPSDIWLNNNVGFYAYIIFLIISLSLLLNRKENNTKKIVIFLMLMLLGNYIRNVFVIDEVMIGLENPFNLVNYGKFSFSPNSMVDGSVDILFLSLLIPFGWTKEILMHANYTLCFLISALTFLCMYRIYKKYTPKIYLFVLLILASSQFFVRIWSPGFPSTFVILFVAYGTYLLLKEKNDKLALLVCFFPLIRPDAILFSASFFFTLLLLEKRFRYRHYIGCIVALGIYFAIIKLLYGHYKPTPMEFKSYYLNESFLKFILPLKIPNITGTITKVIVFLSPAILIIALLKLKKLYKLLFLAIPFFGIIILYSTLSMGTHWGGRYLGFFEIYLFILYSLILLETCQNGRVFSYRENHKNIVEIDINRDFFDKKYIIIFVILIFQYVQFSNLNYFDNHRKNNFKNMDGNAVSGQILSKLIPENWTISTTEINYFGYFIDKRSVEDLAGYTNKKIANSNLYNKKGVKIDPNYLLNNPTDVYWNRVLSEEYPKNHLWIDHNSSLLESTFQNIEKFMSFDNTSPEEFVVGDIRKILEKYDIFLVNYKEWTVVTLVKKNNTDEFKNILDKNGELINKKLFNKEKFKNFYNEKNIKNIKL